MTVVYHNLAPWDYLTFAKFRADVYSILLSITLSLLTAVSVLFLTLSPCLYRRAIHEIVNNLMHNS